MSKKKDEKITLKNEKNIKLLLFLLLQKHEIV